MPAYVAGVEGVATCPTPLRYRGWRLCTCALGGACGLWLVGLVGLVGLCACVLVCLCACVLVCLWACGLVGLCACVLVGLCACGLVACGLGGACGVG